jgi:glutamate carboxypeptidase
MIELLETWAAINSYTYHRPGLTRMADALVAALTPLGHVERIDIPPATTVNSHGELEQHPLGPALRGPHSPGRAGAGVLNIHMTRFIRRNRRFSRRSRGMRASCVARVGLDAKGGLLVLLTAVAAWNARGSPAGIGFHILLTPVRGDRLAWIG